MTEQNTIDIVEFYTTSAEIYSYDGIPQELEQIDTYSQELALEIIELVASEAKSGAPVVLAGGHSYERKGYFSVDPLGGNRNTSYGSKTDDVLLQITVRVDYDRAEKIVRAVTEENIARQEAAVQARRAEIDAEIARLQSQREAL